MTHETDIPRWARPLGTETWESINEKLYEGWQPAAVHKSLSLPPDKLRSLQEHGKRYRNRRVLAPLARLAEMLASGAAEMGPDYLDLLKLVISQALTSEDESKRQRAAGMLGKFFAKVLDVGAEHQVAEDKRESADATKKPVDAEAVAAEIMDVYGVTPGGRGDGDG